MIVGVERADAQLQRVHARAAIDAAEGRVDRAAGAARAEAQPRFGMAGGEAEAVAALQRGVGAEHEAIERAAERRRIAVAADMAVGSEGLAPGRDDLRGIGRDGRVDRDKSRCAAAALRGAVGVREAIEHRLARQARIVEGRRNRAGVDLARKRVESLAGAGDGLADDCVVKRAA